MPDAQNTDKDLGSAQDLGFVPLPEYSRPSTSEQPDDFKSRAKGYEPACAAIWNILVGVPVKILRNRVFRLTDDDEQADTIAEAARPSPESAKAFKEALARKLARSKTNEDAMDTIIILGAVGELGHGFYDCLSAIKDLEKKLLAQQTTKKNEK
jgi:hypothetical protein